jgi:AcrR family transcriptional regulator
MVAQSESSSRSPKAARDADGPPEAEPRARQAKADDTRRRVFAAGAELLAAQGYHATRVEQITRRAGVAKGTFFVYFPTKDALVTDLVRVQVRLVAKERARMVAAGSPPSARLRAVVMALGRLSDINVARAVLAACMQAGDVGRAIDGLYEGVLELMTEDARAAVRAGELSRRTDPEMLALVLMDSFLGATVSYVTNPRGRSLDEMLEALVDTNLAAFAPVKREPGRARTAVMARARKTRKRGGK